MEFVVLNKDTGMLRTAVGKYGEIKINQVEDNES